MRVMVFKRKETGTDVVILPDHRETARPVVLRGLPPKGLKGPVAEALTGFNRGKPKAPAG